MARDAHDNGDRNVPESIGERLAVLETNARPTADSQDRMEDAIKAIDGRMQRLEDALTKASGIKLALMALAAGLTFILSQLWNYLDWKGN
jgi:hypothetical protein